MRTRILQATFLLANMLAASEALAVCTVTITSGPANPTSSTSASFQFAASGCSRGSLQCKLDGASYATCTSPKAYSGLSEGAHTFYATYSTAPLSTDTHPWTIDTTAPTTTITSGPPAYTNDPKPTFTFTSNEAGDFKCKVDSGTYGTCTSPYTTAKLGEGSHTVYVKAIDVAKNEDATPASSTFEVGRFVPWVNQAFWGLETSGVNLVAYGATSGTLVIEDIANGSSAQGFVLDHGGDAVWILRTDDVLASYTHGGSLSSSITPATSPQAGEHVGLAVDVEDGSVWTGYGRTVSNYSASAAHIRTVTLSSQIEAIAFDPAGDRLLVALQGSVVQVSDSTGTVTTIATLTGLGTPTDLTLDTHTRDMWVLTDGYLVGYTSGGALIASTALSGGERVGADGLGGVWVSKANDLLRFDADAALQEDFEPFGPSGTIIDLAADPSTGAAWVSDGTRLKRFDVSGIEAADYSRAVKRICLTPQVSYLTDLGSKVGTGATMRVDGPNWVIKYVFSGSGAEEEDIRVGDELRSINGVAVPDTNASESDHATFLAAVAAARSGATDSMAIVRLGVAYTKTVSTGTYNQHFRTAREFQIAAAGIIKEYPLYAGCYKCVAIPPNGDNITGEMCASANSGHHMCVGLISDGPPPPIGFFNTCDLSIPNCNMNYS